MSENKKQDESAQVSYEHGIPILRAQISEMERQRAESEGRDGQYKSDQIRLNRWLVAATIASVVAAATLGSFQGCYMHRQYILTSNGLSKMGDQIWAAKNASYASEKASDTAGQALNDSKSSFEKTLGQMKAQTRAQQRATRAYVGLKVREQDVLVYDTNKKEIVANFPIINSGQSPAQHVITRYGHKAMPLLPADQASNSCSNIPIPRILPVNDASESVMVPQGFIAIAAGTSDPLQEEWKRIQARTDTMCVFGSIFYTDIFDECHETEFCVFADPSTGHWVDCASHDAMRDFPRKKDGECDYK